MSMTAKEWLGRGWRIDAEINALLAEQRAALDRATGVVPAANGERVQTTRRNSAESKYVSYAAYSEIIDRRIDELYTVKQEILTAIGNVEDATLRTLLTLRYINFHTWEKIACEMNYSYTHVVHTLHPRALAEIHIDGK